MLHPIISTDRHAFPAVLAAHTFQDTNVKLVALIVVNALLLRNVVLAQVATNFIRVIVCQSVLKELLLTVDHA